MGIERDSYADSAWFKLSASLRIRQKARILRIYTAHRDTENCLKVFIRENN